MAEATPEFKKTILIGLGGAGKLILTHIKKFFIDEYNVLPPSIKLLSLDTDLTQTAVRSALGEKQYTLEDQEFLYMKVDQPRQFIEAGEVVKEWFIKPLPAGSIANGAGAVRQNGRLALFFHMNEVLKRVRNMETDLNDVRLPTRMQNAKQEFGAKTNFNLAARSPEIYVCGSLAGGTGSGCFLDVGMLLRDIMPYALIHGFFLLDWVYQDKAFAYRVQSNVYAALSELDNIQSIMYGTADFVPYTIRYADRPVTVTDQPYSLVHLVDGRNEYGENIHQVESLCETVAEAIFLSVGAMGDPISSVADNLLSHVNVQQPRTWKGKFARYSSFGVSSIYYPASELHSFISMDNANRLCEQAILEVERSIADQEQHTQIKANMEQDINGILGEGQLNLLNRSFIRDKVCPFQSAITFQVMPFMIADKGFPQLIEQQLSTSEDDLEKTLEENQQNHGKQFVNDTLGSLGQKITGIEKDPKLDNAYLQDWIDQAVILLEDLKEKATSELNRESEKLNNRKDNAAGLLNLAKASRYIPRIGGARKKRVNEWQAAIINYLTSLKDNKRFEYEKQFYTLVLDMLQSKKPKAVYPASEGVKALKDIQAKLRAMTLEEQNNLKILRSKPNQILIGNGNIVIVPEREGDIRTADEILLDYEQFKSDNNIHKPDDYLVLYQQNIDNLLNLFVNYSLKELSYLKTFTVKQAMDSIGKNKGNKENYIKDQFNHLFRLSSALWSFNKSKMNELHQLQYDKIVNLGVYEQSEGKDYYDQFVTEVKGTYRIRSDHTFSTTGDPHRIWLLNYAAALPVYFLSDLEKKREKYEVEISPTYHIDKYFEMNVPDLFPVDEIRNRALRVIGMAIVPGIDIIHDEKLMKGHKFTFDAEAVRQMNFGDPMVWYLFRDMFDEILEHVNPDGDSLLEVLVGLLKTKVKSISQDELKSYIDNYIKKIQKKLDTRDFSRLVSARLTYVEIKELSDFISPRHYAMDIDRYIGGK